VTVRSPLAGLLGLLSVGLLPVALVAAWVAVMLTRTDVFVDELRPLVRTPQVPQALTEGVVDGVRSRLDLSPAVAAQVEEPLRQGVAIAVASPQVEQIWVSAITAAHREFVGIMEGREPAGLDRRGRVVMAFPVALPDVTARLRSLGVDVPGGLAPVVTVPLVPAADLQEARAVYAVADGVGVWAPAGVAALAVLSIALARRRRRTAGVIAVGWGVGAGLLALLLAAGRGFVADTIADPIARTVADAGYGLAMRGILTEIAAVAAVVLLVLLLLLVVAAVRGRRTY
jgi:hypothetical protein